METTSLVSEPSPGVKANRRRAWLRLCLSISLVVLVCVGITILVLALTVFKARDPTVTLTSFDVTGVAQKMDIFKLRFVLNVSLGIIVTVENPNYASFRHFPGTIEVVHRERRVGEGDVAEGKVPARGKEDMGLNVTVESGNFTAHPADSLSDILTGKMEFKTMSSIPGRVNLLGIIKKDVLIKSNCLIAFSVPDLEELGQHCNHSTTL